MAITKRKGKNKTSYRVAIKHPGMTEAVTATFADRAAATLFVNKFEATRGDQKAGKVPNLPVATLLDRYLTDVVQLPDRKSAAKDTYMIERFKKSQIVLDDVVIKIGEMMLPDLTSSHMAKWMSDRMKEASSGTVRRDWNLWMSVFRMGKVWKMLKVNPLKDPESPMERPADGAERQELWAVEEIARVLYVLGDNVESVNARIGIAFQFALQTGMRLGEIANLLTSDVSFTPRADGTEQGVALLKGKAVKAIGKQSAKRQKFDMTKNGTKREVPLSPEACRLLRLLPVAVDQFGVSKIFNLTANAITEQFSKAVARAGIENRKFHDARHTAITNFLVDIFPILELARIIGHKNLNQLQTYYNKKAEVMAGKFPAWTPPAAAVVLQFPELRLAA